MLSRFVLLPCFALALTAACGQGTGPSAGRGRVALSVAAQTGVAAGRAAQAPATMTLGGTTLVLERVELVLREIELERLEGTEPCPDDTPGSGSDDCEELVFGPLLLDLPLDGGPERLVNVDVAPGVYDELEFDIHKPEDDGRDREFLRANPEFARISIRVRGTFNGQPFVYTSDLNAEQESDLRPPLVVAEARTVSLTLLVDLRQWFLNGSGTAYVDPRSANKGGANENLVRDNIRDSFEALGND